MRRQRQLRLGHPLQEGTISDARGRRTFARPLRLEAPVPHKSVIALCQEAVEVGTALELREGCFEDAALGLPHGGIIDERQSLQCGKRRALLCCDAHGLFKKRLRKQRTTHIDIDGIDVMPVGRLVGTHPLRSDGNM